MSFPLKHSSYRWNIPPSGGVPLRYNSEARKAEKEWVGVFTVTADIYVEDFTEFFDVLLGHITPFSLFFSFF